MTRLQRVVRRPRPTWLALVVLCVTSLLAAFSTGAVVGSTAPAKGAVLGASQSSLTFDRASDIFGFDPPTDVEQYSISLQLQVYDRLVEVSRDGKRLVPGLATSWAITNHGKTVTFTLRKGVRFSDGTPLTTADVIFSLKRATSPKSPLAALFGNAVRTITAPDSSHIRVTLSQPFSPILSGFSIAIASIYSKANYLKWGKAAPAHPLGTGAYQLKSWVKGNQVVLISNPNYWGSPKPKIDTVIFKDVPDANARTLQLQSGAADIIDTVPPNQVSSLQSSGAHVNQVFGPSIQLVWLNEKYKPFADRNVRQALAYSLDRKAIAQRAYFGHATPARSPFPSGTFFYDPTGGISYDMNKARKALARSAYPNGFRFELLVQPAGSPQNTLAQIWAASLKSLGIKLSILPLEQATAFSKWDSTKYQASLTPVWVNDTPDASEFLDFLVFVPNGDRISWTNPQVVALARQAQSSFSPKVRRRAYSQIQRILSREQPLPYVVNIPVLYATSKSVHGFAPNPSGRYYMESVSKG